METSYEVLTHFLRVGVGTDIKGALSIMKLLKGNTCIGSSGRRLPDSKKQGYPNFVLLFM